METKRENTAGGSLRISNEALAKIARLAALEVEGVADVAVDASGVKSLIGRIVPPAPIQVEMKNDVADITISIVVPPGVKVPEVAQKIQENVKQSVQSMTQISVARVNVVVTGICTPDAEASEEA